MTKKQNFSFPLLFIHIPKTAGSSFRVATENYFGSDKIMYDYGEQSDVTHPLVNELIYKKNDRYILKNELTKNFKLLAGHFIYPKYGPFVPARNTIAFVRSPEQQIRSHFEHYVRLHDYKKDFISFIKENRFVNIQSQHLRGLPLEAFGFIGITDYFEDSLSLLNTYYQINLRTLDINKNTEKPSSHYSFSDKEITLIEELNQDDYKLYEDALKRYERQKHCINNNADFLRFHIFDLPPNQAKLKLTGWYTCYENDKAQKISININGKCVSNLTAHDYSSMANERNLNRDGYIGFTFLYPETIKKGDLIEIFSESTEELLYSTNYKY